MPACTATKPNGHPCKAAALPGKRHCLFHDKASAAKTAAGRKKGGEERSKPAGTLPPDIPDAPLATVMDVAGFVAAAMNPARTGRLGVGVSNCLFVGAAALLKALEKSDLDQRLAALEATQPDHPARRTTR